MKPYQIGLAAKVRTQLQEWSSFKVFTAKEVAHKIGAERTQIQDLFRDMMRRGEIVRVGIGLYQYRSGHKLKSQPYTLAPRVYRAIHAKRHFSAREISVITDGKKNSVQKVIRSLIRRGAIRAGGSQKTLRGHIERVYWIKDSNQFFLEYVKPKYDKSKQ